MASHKQFSLKILLNGNKICLPAPLKLTNGEAKASFLHPHVMKKINYFIANLEVFVLLLLLFAVLSSFLLILRAVTQTAQHTRAI